MGSLWASDYSPVIEDDPPLNPDLALTVWDSSGEEPEATAKVANPYLWGSAGGQRGKPPRPLAQPHPRWLQDRSLRRIYNGLNSFA